MANLGKRYAKLPNGEAVDVTLYYIKGKRSYDNPQFFVTPVKQSFLLPDFEELIIQRIGSGYLRGTVGETEQEAIKAFNEYLIKFEQAALKKTPVIFIKIDEPYPNAHFRRERGQKNTEVRINFEYMVGFYMEIDGEKKYYQDKVYHNDTRDNHEYNAEKYWTIVPFTPEALANCENIAANFIALNTKLKKLFGSKKSATEILSSNTNLLTYGTEQPAGTTDSKTKPKPENTVPGEPRNDEEQGSSGG